MTVILPAVVSVRTTENSSGADRVSAAIPVTVMLSSVGVLASSRRRPDESRGADADVEARAAATLPTDAAEDCNAAGGDDAGMTGAGAAASATAAGPAALAAVCAA